LNIVLLKQGFLSLSKEAAKIFSQGPYRKIDDFNSNPAIIELESQIDNLITKLVNEHKLSSRRVFVRLSTRSPKDAILSNDELIDKYIVQSLADNVTDWKDYNQINQILWSAMAKGMQVTTGKEAVRFCLQSSRVRDDCQRELERDDDYAMKIIVREWVDVPIRYEFRSFITHKRINCITQYFNSCYFTEIVENKDLISTAIQSLWESVQHKVEFSNGIVDFALSEDLKTVYIIECNPLDILTGPALFNYFSDWETITGNAQFEFRIVNEITEQVRNEQEGNVVSFRPEINKAIKLQHIREEERRLQKEQKCTIQ